MQTQTSNRSPAISDQCVSLGLKEWRGKNVRVWQSSMRQLEDLMKKKSSFN